MAKQPKTLEFKYHQLQMLITGYALHCFQYYYYLAAYIKRMTGTMFLTYFLRICTKSYYNGSCLTLSTQQLHPLANTLWSINLQQICLKKYSGLWQDICSIASNHNKLVGGKYGQQMLPLQGHPPGTLKWLGWFDTSISEAAINTNISQLQVGELCTNWAKTELECLVAF